MTVITLYVIPITVAQLEKEHSLSEKQRQKESSEAKQATEEHQRVIRGHLEKKVLLVLSLDGTKTVNTSIRGCAY